MFSESGSHQGMDASNLTILELLRAHGAIIEELRRRDIVRSANNPISDLAEILFCRAFGWTRESNSAVGHDATDSSGSRYQIKARRLASSTGSRQLSAIRNLSAEPFDYLAAALFNRDFVIQRAAIIPLAIVKTRVRRSPHTNSDVLHLRDEIWALSEVRDVTEAVRAAFESL